MSSLWHVHVIQASSGTTSTREPLYINNSSSASELSQLSTCPFESSPDQVDKILLKEQIKIMSGVSLAVGPRTDMDKTSRTSENGRWLGITTARWWRRLNGITEGNKASTSVCTFWPTIKRRGWNPFFFFFLKYHFFRWYLL